MVFIIIVVHIQFSTSYFIIVSFVPGLILLYIDSHPPGQFATICMIILYLIDEALWPPASLVSHCSDMEAPPDSKKAAWCV